VRRKLGSLVVVDQGVGPCSSHRRRFPVFQDLLPWEEAGDNQDSRAQPRTVEVGLREQELRLLAVAAVVLDRYPAAELERVLQQLVPLLVSLLHHLHLLPALPLLSHHQLRGQALALSLLLCS